MKRINVIVDEELLEKARVAMGERTFSGAINKALEETYRRHSFRAALRELQAEAAKGGFWDRDYVEQMWPDVAQRLWPRRASAHERRVPKTRAKRR